MITTESDWFSLPLPLHQHDFPHDLLPGLRLLPSTAMKSKPIILGPHHNKPPIPRLDVIPTSLVRRHSEFAVFDPDESGHDVSGNFGEHAGGHFQEREDVAGCEVEDRDRLSFGLWLWLGLWLGLWHLPLCAFAGVGGTTVLAMAIIMGRHVWVGYWCFKRQEAPSGCRIA